MASDDNKPKTGSRKQRSQQGYGESGSTQQGKPAALQAQGESQAGLQVSLRNQFLIATPSLDAGIFKSSVTYICEHDEKGAMGLIINRPSNLVVQDILTDVCDNLPVVEGKGIATPVMVGGPVGLERGFVLHQVGAHEDPERWASSLHVSDDIVLTGSRDILVALSEGRGPEHYLVVLGYAGWGAGQLEQELAANAWLTVPASSDIIFSTPYQERAAAAARLLGIDLASLASRGGTA